MKRIFLIIILFLLSVLPATAETKNKVVKVIDGDTITVSINGKNEVIRLLGIDTPETVDLRKPVQCFGNEASNKMKNFVLGKYVYLVGDPTQGDKDKYNRLLRYVYLSDKNKTFINGEMVKQGFAFSYKQYPTKYLNKFNNFEKYARENNLGLWSSCPVVSKKPTTSPSRVELPTSTPIINQVAPQESNSGGYTCNCSKSCSAITSCDEAYYQLNTCGCSVRDADHDGVPCESICR